MTDGAISSPIARDPLLQPVLTAPKIAALIASGRLLKAHAALRRRAFFEKDPAVRERLRELLADRAAFLEPTRRAPSLFRVNGIGGTFFGYAPVPSNDDLYITTLWWSFIFIPFWPRADFLVSGGRPTYSVYGRVPMAPAKGAIRALFNWGFIAFVLALGFGLWWNLRFATVHVVNENPGSFTVAFDDTRVTAPALGHVSVRVLKGPRHVRVLAPDGRLIDEDHVDIDDGRSFYAYNVFGTAPIVVESLTYRDRSRKGDDDATAPPEFFGGVRFIKANHVDDAFVNPPDQVDLRKNSSAVIRRWAHVLPGGLDATIHALSDTSPPQIADLYTRLTRAFPDDPRQRRRALEAAAAIDGARGLDVVRPLIVDGDALAAIPDTLKTILAADAARAGDRKIAESLIASMVLPARFRDAVTRKLLDGRNTDDLALLASPLRCALIVADALAFPKGDVRRNALAENARAIDTDDGFLTSVLETRP